MLTELILISIQKEYRWKLILPTSIILSFWLHLLLQRPAADHQDHKEDD